MVTLRPLDCRFELWSFHIFFYWFLFYIRNDEIARTEYVFFKWYDKTYIQLHNYNIYIFVYLMDISMHGNIMQVFVIYIYKYKKWIFRGLNLRPSACKTCITTQYTTSSYNRSYAGYSTSINILTCLTHIYLLLRSYLNR